MQRMSPYEMFDEISRGRAYNHLYVAVEKNIYMKTNKLLKKVADDVNDADNQGEAPLLTAARGMNADKLLPQLLTCHGADLQARDSRGRTVLHITVGLDRVQLTKWLLEKGADVNAADSRGKTPLLIAMIGCKKPADLVLLLIQHGADLQARDMDDNTALHFALTDGYYYGDRVQLTDMLLEKGAEVNVANIDGKTPLLVAVGSKKANELVPLLMKRGANIFAKDRCGKNALHHLAWNGSVEHADLARYLIEKGVSLDDREYSYQSQPIHFATSQGKNELVKLFLDHGANVNALGEDGKSPLYIAARCDNPAVMRTLLERGANVHLRTSTAGRTALHYACDISSIMTENVRQLLFAGADLLAEDKDGKTPFALLAYKNEDSIGTRLLMKMLAVKRACLGSPSIELKDERIIEKYPAELRDYYQDCVAHASKMKFARFAGFNCTFLEMLTRRPCQIAALMRNPEFKAQFMKDYEAVSLLVYAEELRQAFERAGEYCHARIQLENVIKEAFYDALPDVIVDKVVHKIICNCLR